MVQQNRYVVTFMPIGTFIHPTILIHAAELRGIYPKRLKDDLLLRTITTHMNEDTVRHLNIFPETTTEVRNDFATDMPTARKGILKDPAEKPNERKISFNSENLATITSIPSKKLKIFAETPLATSSLENALVF